MVRYNNYQKHKKCFAVNNKGIMFAAMIVTRTQSKAIYNPIKLFITFYFARKYKR